MPDIKIDDSKIKILEASGYNDGYYWDMNASFEYEGETYSCFDGGSGSGYYLCTSGIIKEPFERLFRAPQKELEDTEWMVETISYLLHEFINSGAKVSWSSNDDEDGKTHIFVDDVEITSSNN